MKINWLLNAFLLVSGVISTEFPPYYLKLMEYARLASVAYCLKEGLTPGRLGSKESHCPLEVCQEREFRNIEIVSLFDSNQFGQVGSGFYAVDHSTKRVLLVFRGTSTRRDLVSDLDFFPVEYNPLATVEAQSVGKEYGCDGCKAHRGFYRFLRKNCPTILEEVVGLMEDKDHKDYKLVVVGHSLGAALAVLSGIEFKLMGYDPLVLSYAGPKIGNRKFVEYTNKLFNMDEVSKSIEENKTFDSGLIRIVHRNDVVPNLPPSPIFEMDGYVFFIDKKKLPHFPEDVRLLGTQAGVNEVSLNTIGSLSPIQSWSNFLGKYEHSHYLIKITGCEA